MKEKVIICICLLLSCFISNVQGTSSPVDYKLAFTTSKICANGKLQSPINLVTTQSQFVDDISFLSDDYDTLSGKLSYDGNVFSVRAPNGRDWGTVYLTKHGYLTKNLLKEIRVNAPSEHLLEGKPGNLEVKLIHERVIGYNSNVNANRKIVDANMYFTISILFTLDDNAESDGGFINQLFKGWQTQTTGASFVSEELNYNMNDFELIRAKQFYFYEGSHTTIPCNENVNHIVINNFFKIDKTLMDYITSQFTLRYLNGRANKSTSQLNGRAVYRNFILPSEVANSYTISLSLFLLVVISLILM